MSRLASENQSEAVRCCANKTSVRRYLPLTRQAIPSALVSHLVGQAFLPASDAGTPTSDFSDTGSSTVISNRENASGGRRFPPSLATLRKFDRGAAGEQRADQQNARNSKDAKRHIAG